MSLPLKRLATVIAGQSPVSDEVEDLADGLPFIQGNAEFGLRHPSPKWQCTTAPKVACMDDVLISVRAPVGATNIAEGPLGIGRGVAAVRATDMNPAYLYWFLTSSSDMLHAEATGSTFAAITASDLGDLEVPITDVADQRSIADYLDRETATIDALIDKQTAHVGLLRERRLAAQNRAVMGLDLDSDLIEGEQVPVGWTSGPIKRVLESLDSRRVPLNADERGARQGSFPYYGASGVIDSVDDYLFDGDLVLVGEDGANLLNRSTPLAFVAYGQYWVNNHAHVLRPKFGPVEFWAARIEALDVSPVVSGSAQPKLTADALMALRISWPENPDDMARIVEVMTRETAKIDALIAKAERFIELAQERRAALITAAVTGQIEIPTED